jgi:hypothetical protein
MIVGLLSVAILGLLALFLAQRTGVLGGRG